MNRVKERLKGFFRKGNKPTEEHFAELIDRGVYLDENGDLGIGIDEPEAKLHINAVAGSEVVIRDDGKVGIGTKSPSVKLDVTGKIKTHGIELSQDIRHNGVPVMGFLESPLSNPAIPIRAQKFTDVFLSGSPTLSIPHEIDSLLDKIVGLIPYTIGNFFDLPPTPAAFFAPWLGSQATSRDIIEVAVTNRDIHLRRRGGSFGETAAVVFLLYLDL